MLPLKTGTKNLTIYLSSMGHIAAMLTLWLGFINPSWALFTFSSYLSARRLTLQVGSTDLTVDRVTIEVPGNAISPNSTLVSGNSNGPSTSPSGGVEIRAYMGYTNTASSNEFRLTVDSSVGLTCVAGSGCGSTLMPFSTIGWTAYNNDSIYPTFDIQTGQFNGSNAQTLANFYVSGGSLTMTNVLVFHYNSTTIYPAGQYTGRVTYTAALP